MIIILIILILLFWINAAVCDAIMDNIKDHWYKSKFNKLNSDFWNPEVSWKRGYLKGSHYHLDAWHLFKTIRISSQCLSGTLLFVLGKYITLDWYWYIGIFGLLGGLWDIIFNISYNKILIH